ncbi:hypothetical protein DIPPA_51747 [Diplonema papillatum]|nr:hypothetical protein DIPPA_51747 [Diplonema papillatum]
MNGAEMAPGTWYEFAAGTSVSVFTWHGCNLELKNVNEDDVYAVESTEMFAYARAHSLLEKKRIQARDHEGSVQTGCGPRVLICGGPCSGKATISRILLNYAARSNWQVTYADLDFDNNTITCPGSIAAVPVDMPIPVDEGFSVFPPLMYYYGNTDKENVNTELNSLLVGQLAAKVLDRQEQNDAARRGGVIVKAMAFNPRKGAEEITHIINSFKIDIVFVVGDDRLHAKLSSQSETVGAGHRRADVIKLPRSNGCCFKSDAQREAARNRSIHTYFYGWPHMRLHPHRYEIVDAATVKFVKVGQSLSTMEGLLPIGEQSTLTATDVTPVQPGKELEHTLVALSQAQVESDVSTAPIFGFAKVLSVGEGGRSVELLIPVPVTSLETDTFIVGEVRHFE